MRQKKLDLCTEILNYLNVKKSIAKFNIKKHSLCHVRQKLGRYVLIIQIIAI